MESGAVTSKDLFKTLVGQLASILNMVMTGVRNLKDVTDVLQIIIADPDFASKLLGEAQQVAKKAVVKLLVFVGTIAVPVLTETWNALDRFKKDLSSKGRVKIYEAGSNFKSWFGPMVVGTHIGSTLSYYTLTQNMHDREIIAELGGEANVEVTLAEIWFLMEQQRTGGNGALLNNSYANIFYVRDAKGVLRAVYVYWDNDGWDVSANAIGSSYWHESWRVFVRQPNGLAGNSMQP